MNAHTHTQTQTATTFKYGQKIYSKVSLHSGIVTDIELPSPGQSSYSLITIDRGKELGTETWEANHFTTDADVVLELMRQQMEEYKEADLSTRFEILILRYLSI